MSDEDERRKNTDANQDAYADHRRPETNLGFLLQYERVGVQNNFVVTARNRSHLAVIGSPVALPPSEQQVS